MGMFWKTLLDFDPKLRSENFINVVIHPPRAIRNTAIDNPGKTRIWGLNGHKYHPIENPEK